MKRFLRWSAILFCVLAAGLLGYAATGFFAARADAPRLAARADWLIQNHRGPADLGPGRADQILLVDDPGFRNHSGVDLASPGAGLTTLTQSLSKRVGFSNFRPGIAKLRLMGHAVGLESRLSKEQILALYLDTVWMGRGPNGRMTGYFGASQAIYGRPPAALSDREFLTLVAVPIAPRDLTLANPNPLLLERVRRIERLVQNRCRPNGLRDVWLEGCA
jgi:monofunctional biosynthetic peptidoglycan transglycosylase